MPLLVNSLWLSNGQQRGHLALRCLREAVNGSHSWARSFRCVWGGLVKGRSCWHGRSRRGVITSCMNFLQTGRISLLRVALNIMTCFSWGVTRKISWTSRRMSAGDSKRTMHSYNYCSCVWKQHATQTVSEVQYIVLVWIVCAENCAVFRYFLLKTELKCKVLFFCFVMWQQWNRRIMPIVSPTVFKEKCVCVLHRIQCNFVLNTAIVS